MVNLNPFGMRCEHLHFWESPILSGEARIIGTNRADGPTAELILFHYFHGRASWHGSTRTIEMVRR
jgi:hypothetical protein